VTIDFAAHDGIMREISSEFNVSREEFTGENRESFCRYIFDFKRRKMSKKKVFTWMIGSDGVYMYGHYRRLKADRPIVSTASSSARHQEKEAHLATQELQENDVVVVLYPGNTNIMTIPAPKCRKNGTKGNLC
jgi:hypothetical protein